MNQFRLYGMNQLPDGSWRCRLVSDPFTDIEVAREWYRTRIEWRGYDIVHVELSDGSVYPAISFDAIERIINMPK